MIVTTKELFKEAYGEYALGAYYINNAEQTMGLFRGNMDSKAPFIVQISRGARHYTNELMLESMIRAADQIFPDAIFATHLDHGDEATCYDCIDSGFYSSVMIDASHDDFEGNIATTRRVVEKAHAKGISVEAELGQLGGVEEHVSVSEDQAHLTDPKQAAEFIERSGCDSLACAIYTTCSAFKFARDRGPHFGDMRPLVPGFPLALRGSSSIPNDEVERINAAGGAIRCAKGVDPAQYLSAAKLGVCKMSIHTDSHLVWTRVHREFFRDQPDKFDFRPVGKIFMDEYAKFIASRNHFLGSAGRLDEVRAALGK